MRPITFPSRPIYPTKTLVFDDTELTMPQRYAVKIVPDRDPNADGEWVDVECRSLDGLRFRDAQVVLTDYVPDGFHVVRYERR